MNRYTECKVMLDLALLLLHIPIDIIKALFTCREINCTDDKKVKAVEFFSNQTCVSCLFTEDNKCQLIFLFTANPDDVEHYRTYCKKKFPFNVLLHGWIHNDFLIQIKDAGRTPCLLILPTQLAKRMEGYKIRVIRN